jgi:hypothetical protein
VSVSGGTIQSHVGAGSDPATADVLLVGYLPEATTPIGRGENSGRTLKESNIVFRLHELGRWNGKPREFDVSLSRLPENVTDIALLVQSAGQGAILGAVAQSIRGPLSTAQFQFRSRSTKGSYLARSISPIPTMTQ